MSKIIVGVADFKINNNIEDILVTYALGSCIAVVVYDARVKVGGMLHLMLDNSALNSRKASEKPAMFADTGIPLLFKSCYKLGAEKRYMAVKIAGGAGVLNDNKFFKIGKQNITAVKKIFWKNNVILDGEDTGGNFNRTVELYMATGKVVVRNSSKYIREL